MIALRIRSYSNFGAGITNVYAIFQITITFQCENNVQNDIRDTN